MAGAALCVLTENGPILLDSIDMQRTLSICAAPCSHGSAEDVVARSFKHRLISATGAAGSSIYGDGARPIEQAAAESFAPL
jgi:hypothetical protein